MVLLNELLKKAEEKNRKLIEKEKSRVKKSGNKKNNKSSKKLNGEELVVKDKDGNIHLKTMNGEEVISLYDIGLMWKQVEEREKEIKDILKKLNSEKNVKYYIAYKFGSVLNPNTNERFVFPYVSQKDEDYAYKYGRVIMDILFYNIEELNKIMNFE